MSVLMLARLKYTLKDMSKGDEAICFLMSMSNSIWNRLLVHKWQMASLRSR